MRKTIRRDQLAPNICDSDPILPIPDYQSQSDTTITNTDPDPNLCPYLALTLV